MHNLLQRQRKWLTVGCLLLWGLGVCSVAFAARKKRSSYVWEDISDGLFSLNATCVGLDPKDPQRAYAGVNGILYVTKDRGLSWRPLVRFSGSARTNTNATSLGARLRRLKERILEEKLEDLAAEVGEERAQESRTTLEREAEEEAEQRLRQQLRGRTLSSGPTNRFRRRINRIVVSPTNTNQILVATDGGAFLTTDGKNFNRTFRGRGGEVEGNVITALIDPKNPKLMLLGTQRGLWLTKDGGKFWKRIFGKMRTLPIRELRRDPLNPKIIYAATPRALFVSYDSGKNFREKYTLTSSGPQRITTLAVLATQPKSTIVLGTGNGLYTSTNAIRFRPLRVRGIGVRSIVYLTSVPTAPKYLYMINERGVFLSTNKGRSFRQLRAGIPTSDIRFIITSPQNPLSIWSASGFGLHLWSPLLGGKLTKLQWKRFQRDSKREPTPWQTSRAVLRYMHLDRDLSKLYNNYRLRALLPQIQIRGQMYLDRDINTALIGRGIPINILEGRAFLLQAVAIWPLGRWIYGQREVSILSQTRAIRSLRDRVLTRTIRLYHARRRLQFRLFARPPKKLRRYLRGLLKLQEMTAYINGLSGNKLRFRLLILKSRGTR